MSSELVAALEALAVEKNIDEMYLLERLETTLAKSYRDILKLKGDVSVTINRETGEIYVYEKLPVGEIDPETGEAEGYEERDVTPRDVSRIAAMSAKSVILSIVRDAARQAIFTEYSDRKGELVTGTVLQTTADFTIIKVRDGVEAELPHFDLKRSSGEHNEKPTNEHYRHNQRLKSLIIEVRDPAVMDANSRGENTRPSIVVSRTHPDLIRRLFEIEVPEIYDGIVEIRSIAREAGARSKIAVHSRENNLDPVGACVGPKGSRVRMVVDELRNERVDVIQWSDNPSIYVANALSPAKVTSVMVDDDTHYATVVVPDDQLSLAIGKEGQNARLAARLTGWHIDIKSASLAGELSTNITTLFDEEEPSPESEDGRCEHVSVEGIRCRNHAVSGSHFCRLHEGDQLMEGAVTGEGAESTESAEAEDVVESSDIVEATVPSDSDKAKADVADGADASDGKLEKRTSSTKKSTKGVKSK